MKANYHTHSKWCHHGSGELEDFIKVAIEAGMEELAFTEHVPHINRFSWMTQDEFLAFDKDLNRCIEIYGDKLNILKGFECEYIPGVLDLYKRYRDEYGYTFLIMGQHNAGEGGEINMFEDKDSDAVARYGEYVVRGLETGLFRYLAHPDLCLIKYELGWDKVCERTMTEVFQACKELHIPIEFNANGYRGNREYPNRECWKLAAEYDLCYMVGADAHNPKDLCDDVVESAFEVLKDWGLTPTEIYPRELL